MARVVFRLNGGIASDIRFAPADYVLQPGEVETQADELPTPEQASSAAAWGAKADQVRSMTNAAASAERARSSAVKELERLIRFDAPQQEINAALLKIIKADT